MAKETKQTLFQRAETVLEVARKLQNHVGGMNTEGKEGGAYLYISSIFLHSAADDFATTFILLEKDIVSGAFLSLRRLCELDIDLRFIGNSPVERSKQFLYYGAIQQEKYLSLLEKADWAKSAAIDETKRNNIRLSSEEAMRELDYKKPPRQWSPQTWASKCLEIDRKLSKAGRKLKGMMFERSYEVVYKYCCGYSHPSAWGLTQFIEDVPGGAPMYVQPVKEGLMVAALAISIFLDIVLVVNRVFSADLDEEILEIYKGLDGWMPF